VEPYGCVDQAHHKVRESHLLIGFTVADGQLHDSDPAIAYIGCHHHVNSVYCRQVHNHGFLIHVSQAQLALVLKADSQYLSGENTSCHAYGYVSFIGPGGESRAMRTDD
jgi:hypothetical protein